MSSDDDGDEYVIHGKLLDPIQEDEIVKKKDTEQQFVKDENGRRRFHGAFTGGFSAGFYNTVGSLEGWTPSTFKSSRNSKSTPQIQNAYDIMDDEDKKELGIDSSSLKIKGEYSDYSSRKRQHPEINTGPIPGKPVLGEILKPINDTWGVELLKSMGWKPGQGVGPQLTQREKIRSKYELENIGMKFDTNDDIDEEIELLKNIKVSPYEYESKAIKPKTDTFGLGYKGLNITNVIGKPTNTYSKLTVGKKSIHGQAFGVGAYENDDDDIYATEDMSNYDFTLEDKNQKSKTISKSKKCNLECIDGFVEDDIKRDLLDEHSSLQIPPEWRPQGIFERIMGQCIDTYCQSSNISNINVNTRLSEMKKSKPALTVDTFVKKEVPNLLTEIISDRFTRAVLQDDSTNILLPVIRTTDPVLQQLKMYAEKKMYGFWTRKTEPWIPDKLLCKRFNIPVPKQINHTNDKKHGECSLFSSLQFSSHENQLTSSCESQIPNSLPSTINNMITNNDDKCNLIENIKEEIPSNDTEKYPSEKPSVDFFKAIFLDNSSDDDILNEKNIIHSPEISSSNKEPLPNIKPSTICPPKGIFANLKFDDLLAPNKKNDNTSDYIKKTQTSSHIKKSYGPSLPEDKNLNIISVNINNIITPFEDDEWVEKSESSHNESNHKNKRKKHKKNKHKKKSHR